LLGKKVCGILLRIATNAKNAAAPWHRTIQRTGDWILDRRPRVWACLYLLLIPVAGIAFTELPAGSFYDANLTRESGFQDDLNGLASQLTQAIEDQENGDDVGYKLPEPSWKFSGSTLKVNPILVFVQPGSITVDSSGNLDFSILGFASSSPIGKPYTEVRFDVPVTLATSQQGELAPFKDGYSLAMYPITSTAQGLGADQPGLDVLFPGVGSQSIDGSMVEMDPSVAQDLDKLSTAGKGDPKFASGLRLRMFYFSAVTITTLGYGDITPVTSLARLLVSIEAITGVVLVGFFLNAVARKLSNS